MWNGRDVMGTIVKLHHMAMSVRNLKESTAWYEEMFGMKVVKTMTIEHTGSKIAFVANGDFVIEMLQVPDSAPTPKERSHPDTDNATQGFKHYCITVKDNKQFIKGLVDKGVKIVFEFQPEGDESYCAFVNDPTGNVIEIFDDRNRVADKILE